MSVLIFGAGAIGQWLGALLASEGVEVQLHGRPRVAKALAQLGGVQIDQGPPIPIPFSSEPRELKGREFDTLICTVKTFAVPSAVAEIKSLKLKFNHLVSFQNGWGTEHLYSDAFPEHKFWNLTTTRAVGAEGPGRLTPSDKGGLAIAPADESTRGLPPAQIRSVRIPLIICQRGQDLKWSKLLLNLIGNATGAVTGLSPNQYAAHPKLMRAEILLCREALAVGKALGIQRVDLPGFPIKLLSNLIETLPLGLVTPIIARKFRGARGDKLPSLFQDLEHPDKPTEIDHLNGAVVEQGKKVGVATPRHDALTRLFHHCRREPATWHQLRAEPTRLAAMLESPR